MTEYKTSIKNTLRFQAEALLKTLSTLTPREEWIVSWRLGLMESHKRRGLLTIEDVARYLKVSTANVLETERRAIRKLKVPKRSAILREAGLDPRMFSCIETQHPPERQRLESLQRVVACVRALSPELVAHLRSHHDDISLIPPDVFEHLVAELFASWGWDEVRLVGRNSETSADILAGRFDHNLGEQTRYFIEVKKWKRRIGIEVINQVLGAMIDERPKFGWHAAMIVTVAGLKDLRKYTREELRLKGVWIKDRSDLDRWLDGYNPAPTGLWLPPTACHQANGILPNVDYSRQDMDKTSQKANSEDRTQSINYQMRIRPSESPNEFTVEEGGGKGARGFKCTVEVTFTAKYDPYAIRIPSQSIHLKAKARRKIIRYIGLQLILRKVQPYLKGLPMPSKPDGSEAIIIYLPERHDEFERIMSEIGLDARMLTRLAIDPSDDNARETPIEAAQRILRDLTQVSESTGKGKEEGSVPTKGRSERRR